MKYKIASSILVASLLISGCAIKTERIDMNNDQAGQVMGLDYRDFNEAAAKAVQSLLKSGALDKKDNDRVVIAISDIKNDTMQHIDTDQLIKKIRVDLLRSGRAVITTAIGSNVDSMNKKVRELNDNDDFNQRTTTKKGQMIAPEMSLSGKIIQRNITMDDGKQQVEYYFQLTLTELSTGLAWWEDEVIIGKRGSAKAVAW
ncbi:MAG: penicillin-binding protein activator LpoB [Arcobacter sp.]|nr:MAG: penicillin-binding protein activator LpoB [Arcobacter sp.]